MRQLMPRLRQMLTGNRIMLIQNNFKLQNSRDPAPLAHSRAQWHDGGKRSAPDQSQDMRP
ncbi:hypothetical protein ROS9278_04339 [Roseomonas sp. CECT 9278]|nr:hypothetical protein ROS9278_04339 [Roseomonas sp. CECT 9278]